MEMNRRSDAQGGAAGLLLTLGPRRRCDTQREAGDEGEIEPRASYRVKFIVTVIKTSVGVPFSNVGVNNHCRTAPSAA